MIKALVKVKKLSVEQFSPKASLLSKLLLSGATGGGVRPLSSTLLVCNWLLLSHKVELLQFLLLNFFVFLSPVRYVP